MRNAVVLIKCPACAKPYRLNEDELGPALWCPFCHHSLAAEAPAPLPQRPTYVVFDLETTGLAPRYDAIIQIAGVRLCGGVIDESDFFATYVNPGCRIPPFIQSYTGVTEDDVRDAPHTAQALEAFSRYVGESGLIAHNGHRFDMAFIRAACERYGLATRPVYCYDSLSLSRRLWGRGNGHSLDIVVRRLQITAGMYRRHDARGDVHLLAEAVSRMWGMLSSDYRMQAMQSQMGVLPA